MSAPDPEDKALRVEEVISGLLHWGVLGSLTLITAGTVLCFLEPGTYGVRGGSPADLHRFLTAGAAFPRQLAWFLGGLSRLDGTAVIVAGLLLLIATPVIRVAVSIIAFASVRDRMYAAITSVVLALLLFSFYLGKAG